MNLGTIMMDVSGLTLSEKEKTQLGKPSIGGVILFSRNFTKPCPGKCLPTHFMPASCMPLIRLPANFTTTSGLE
jgi:beta-N-acetylhexosaminidase